VSARSPQHAEVAVAVRPRRRHQGGDPIRQLPWRQVPRGSAAAAWFAAGTPGINRIVCADARVEVLDHVGQAPVGSGDIFEIHATGSGGYGPP